MTLLRYEPWWRMPEPPKRPRTRRRRSRAALSFAGYWIVALGAAYAVHVEWLPARRWLVASTSTAMFAQQARVGRTVEIPIDVPLAEPDPVAPLEPAPVALPPDDEPEREPERRAEPAPERAVDPPRPAKRKRPRPERRREAPIAAPVERSERRRVEPPEPPPPERRRPEPEPKRRAERARPSSGGGTSCEAAIGSYNEAIRMGDRSTPPDISQARYAAVLNRGTYFQHCGIPDSTSIRICAAVQHGRAVGVTVTTNPPSASQQRCIANAVRGLAFPSHPRMDVTTTVFE